MLATVDGDLLFQRSRNARQSSTDTSRTSASGRDPSTCAANLKRYRSYANRVAGASGRHVRARPSNDQSRGSASRLVVLELAVDGPTNSVGPRSINSSSVISRQRASI